MPKLEPAKWLLIKILRRKAVWLNQEAENGGHSGLKMVSKAVYTLNVHL